MRVLTQLYEYLPEEAIYFLEKIIPKQKEPRLNENQVYSKILSNSSLSNSSTLSFPFLMSTNILFKLGFQSPPCI